jgi:crotonobetainyl-CoA:carnitine CoA-transferase CaiB-like acyl-CoA transferase
MSAKDLYLDQHLRTRGMWTTVQHGRMGEIEVLSMPWIVNGARPEMRPAPIVGQDNDYVYRELLGLTAQDHAALVEAGVVN